MTDGEALQKRRGVIGGAIIDHDNLVAGVSLPGQRVEATAEDLAPIAGRDHHRDERRIRRHRRHGR
jgi:hypothetical protein